MVKDVSFLLKFFEILGNKVKDLEMGNFWFYLVIFQDWEANI